MIDCPTPPDMVQIHVAGCAPPPRGPIYADEWLLLLAQAEKSLASRQEHYPAWIKRGQITQADADRDIRAWELLVAEWRWIVTGEGAPPPADTLADRRAAVALSQHRIEAELSRGNRTHEMYRQAHLANALEWHLATLKFEAPAVHFFADLTRKCRADADARARLPERNAA